MGTAAALLLVGLAGACGEDSDPAQDRAADPAASTTPTPSGPGESTGATEPVGPRCDDVWVDGEVLPRDYRGCQDGERWVKAFVYPCESGQRLVTFGRTFYAAKGEVVNESSTTLVKDREFKQALAACGA